jgi:hypothetical protein
MTHHNTTKVQNYHHNKKIHTITRIENQETPQHVKELPKTSDNKWTNNMKHI